MNNTFSIESILFKDMYSNNNKSISNTKVVQSLDDCVYDAYKSSEDLKFYETYTMINDYNNTQKLRMLNKLRYATNNIKNKQAHNSCESYIRSLEEDTNTTENVEKKKNIFIRIFEGIKNAIIALGKWIKKIWGIFINFITGKNKNDNEQFKDTSVNNAATSEPTAEQKTVTKEQKEQNKATWNEQYHKHIGKSNVKDTIDAYNAICDKYGIDRNKYINLGKLKPSKSIVTQKVQKLSEDYSKAISDFAQKVKIKKNETLGQAIDNVSGGKNLQELEKIHEIIKDKLDDDSLITKFKFIFGDSLSIDSIPSLKTEIDIQKFYENCIPNSNSIKVALDDNLKLLEKSQGSLELALTTIIQILKSKSVLESNATVDDAMSGTKYTRNFNEGLQHGNRQGIDLVLIVMNKIKAVIDKLSKCHTVCEQINGKIMLYVMDLYKFTQGKR